MKTHELEDLTLLLVGDADEPAAWMARWAASYPVVAETEISAHQNMEEWRQAVHAAFASVQSKNVAVVAYGAGVSGFLAWLYRADVNERRKVGNIILADPLPHVLPDDGEHALQKVRCPCPTALVIGEPVGGIPEWIQEKARLWQARLLVSPHPGRLNGALGGWQWGMKLMQEMLLA